MGAVSTFSWLDHRDDDQKRVRDALAAFDQPGIVDPLGFGVVRDTFSEMLFPGVSTVQTRARYFLLVPWVYQRLDRERVAPKDGARRAREWELELIESLLRGSDEREGIIGRNSRQRTKQLPSFIYWGGLGRWQVRRFAGTRQEYVGTLRQRRQVRRRAGEDVDDPTHVWEPWPGLPAEPEGLYEATSLDLDVDEADFLRGRALLATKGTYLELLVRDGTTELDWGDAPWEHPLSATAPADLVLQLHHARLFSWATLGASLLYNALLSDLLEEDGYEPLTGDYPDRLEQWVDDIQRMSREIANWDRTEFWWLIQRENPRASGARGFVDYWLDRVTADPQATVTDPRVARALVDRENSIKRARAKLANRRARERSPTSQGGEMMVYRWPQVQQIIGDIHTGLEQHAQPS